MTRKRVFQQPPDDNRDYRRFPRRTFKAGSRWFRQHAADEGPWWFSSSGDGRFDLDPPHGTCYLAGTPAAALRERLGPDLARHGWVTASLLSNRVVSALELPVTVKAANLESDRAADVYGITGELAVMTPYDVSRAWAAVLHRAGFGGVHARLRFSPQPGSAGLSIFGAAGAPDWAADADPVDAKALADSMGLVGVEPPDDDEITFA